jgi:hypothetical protein
MATSVCSSVQDPVAMKLVPSLEFITQALLRDEARRAGTKCLIALRMWEFNHVALPTDLTIVVREAGLPDVPIDPFSEQPMLMTTIDDNPVIYSVGSDERDDHALADWNYGRQPGDFIFRLDHRPQ